MNDFSKERQCIFETERGEKDILEIECTIVTEETTVSKNDLKERLLLAMEDSKFLEICQNENKKEFVTYLINNKILELTQPENCKENTIRMGWWHTNSNIYSDINVAVEGGAVAVTLVAAAAEAAEAAEAVALIAVYIVAKPSPDPSDPSESFLRNETFRTCVKIAGKLGGQTFRNDILNVFKDLESGKKVLL